MSKLNHDENQEYYDENNKQKNENNCFCEIFPKSKNYKIKCIKIVFMMFK